MATVASDVREDEVSLLLDNRLSFTADQLVLLIQTVATLARDEKHFGPDCVIEVVEIRTGSLAVLFRFITGNRAGVIRTDS